MAELTQLPDGLLDKPEVAKLLKISDRRLDHWMKLGKLPFYKFGKAKNAAVRFKASDIDAALSRFKVEAI